MRIQHIYLYLTLFFSFFLILFCKRKESSYKTRKGKEKDSFFDIEKSAYHVNEIKKDRKLKKNCDSFLFYFFFFTTFLFFFFEIMRVKYA